MTEPKDGDGTPYIVVEHELLKLLSSNVPEERVRALDLVSRLESPPKEVVPGVIRALRNRLDDDPLGDETVVLLAAVYNVAEGASGFIDTVKLIRRSVRDREGERAELVRRLADAVQKKMEAWIDTAEQRWNDLAKALAKMIAAEQHEAAEAFVCERLDDPEQEVVGHAALYEAAGDLLAGQPKAAHAAYARAFRLFQIYASWSSSGGEGYARMGDVHRVEKKMRDVL